MRHLRINRMAAKLWSFVFGIILIAITFIVASPLRNAVGQQRGHTGSHQKAVRKPAGATGVAAVPATPIPVADPALERLPAGYMGESGGAIYSILEKYKQQFVKSQFETTADFRARIETLVPQIRFNSGKSAADRFTFVITSAEESYDADNELFTLKLTTDHEYFDMDYPKELLAAFETGTKTQPDSFRSALNDDFISFSIAHTSRTVGSSIGQNAFGIRRRFSIKTYTHLKLAMWRTNISPYNETINFHATPAAARAASGYVFLAFNGRLRFPFIRHEADMDEATLTSPVESHYSRYYLFFEPDSLVVYNGRTGEVFGSVALPLRDQRTAIGSGIMLDKFPLTEPSPVATVQPEEKSAVPEVVSAPQPTPKPTPMPTISQGELNGKAISKPQPPYPPIAIAARASGMVVVLIVVDETGKVTSAHATSGHPLLQRAAEQAAYQALFEPTLISGKPVKVSGFITYNFVLQ